MRIKSVYAGAAPLLLAFVTVELAVVINASEDTVFPLWWLLFLFVTDALACASHSPTPL